MIFVFFAHKMYSRAFIKLELNHDVTWTILTTSLLCFCALSVVGPLLSTEGKKALGFHQKYLNLKDISKYFKLGELSL